MNTAEKLTLLANHLETIPARKIRLEDWQCGTAACAVGHACTIPEFQKLGLRIETETDSTFGWPVYGEDIGWDATNEFFGLNEDESQFLFNVYTSSQLENPKRHVIKRLRKFVANQVQS